MNDDPFQQDATGGSTPDFLNPEGGGSVDHSISETKLGGRSTSSGERAGTAPTKEKKIPSITVPRRDIDTLLMEKTFLEAGKRWLEVTGNKDAGSIYEIDSIDGVSLTSSEAIKSALSDTRRTLAPEATFVLQMALTRNERNAAEANVDNTDVTVLSGNDAKKYLDDLGKISVASLNALPDNDDTLNNQIREIGMHRDPTIVADFINTNRTKLSPSALLHLGTHLKLIKAGTEYRQTAPEEE